MDSKTTKKLLKQARVQQQQLEDELAEVEEGHDGGRSTAGGKSSRTSKAKFNLGGGPKVQDSEEDEDELAASDDDEADEGNFAQEIVRYTYKLRRIIKNFDIQFIEFCNYSKSIQTMSLHWSVS